MKRQIYLALLTVLVLALAGFPSAHAELIPPHGEGQIGLQAVVLCEKLTLRQEPNSTSRALKTLQYQDLPIVIRQQDGWAYVALGDSIDSLTGWVNADFLIIDPAWFRTADKTPVYAWDDVIAPKVALLDANITLPILKQAGDWIVVSLRGAAGWIYVGGIYQNNLGREPESGAFTASAKP